MDVSEKIRRKCLLKMFVTEDEVLMGQRHLSKCQCEIFNLLIFALACPSGAIGGIMVHSA